MATVGIIANLFLLKFLDVASNSVQSGNLKWNLEIIIEDKYYLKLTMLAYVYSLQVSNLLCPLRRKYSFQML